MNVGLHVKLSSSLLAAEQPVLARQDQDGHVCECRSDSWNGIKPPLDLIDVTLIPPDSSRITAIRSEQVFGGLRK
jgi:hypothetical protein